MEAKIDKSKSTPPRIAFITDAITENHAGVGRYARNIFRELEKAGNKMIPVDWREERISTVHISLGGHHWLFPVSHISNGLAFPEKHSCGT